MDGQILRPDEVALRRDLESLSFRLGERRGLWERVKLAFPYLYVRVAAPVREQGPKAFLLRIDCRGYQAVAPTAALWDGPRGVVLPLALRPRQASGQVVLAFSSGCGDCLYHPIDRVARSHWPNRHADLAWGPNSTIITFLECVHGLLHDRDYHASTASDATAILPQAALDPFVGRAA